MSGSCAPRPRALAPRPWTATAGVEVFSDTPHTDSSAANGMASRSSADRIRQIERWVLWIQEAMKNGLGFDKPSGPVDEAPERLGSRGAARARGGTLIKRDKAA